MFTPFFLFVGHRYTRFKSKNHFISFISLTSMLGIALGVMVLITVLSVMNGFSKEIRSHMLSVAPHVTLRNVDGNLQEWDSILSQIATRPLVAGAAPFIAAHGMLMENNNVQPAIIMGVDPNQINNVYQIQNNIIAGSLNDLTKDNFGIILGKELAERLGVWINNKITLIAPQVNISLVGITPRIKRLSVVAIFDNGSNYDNLRAFIHLDSAKKIYKMGNNISGIQIKVQDELYAAKVAQDLNQYFADKYWISDWTQEFSHFFEAIKMEKTVMWCILFLIITVAVFNLVSTLVMVVTDKRSDIAIMRTMGASSKQIMGIFIVQGAIVGIIGTLLGLILGLLLAHYVTQIVDFIQLLFNIKFISEEVYLIGFVPSEIKPLDVIIVCCFSIIMSLLATIYPAWHAARIQPAEALRYE